MITRAFWLAERGVNRKNKSPSELSLASILYTILPLVRTFMSPTFCIWTHSRAVWNLYKSIQSRMSATSIARLALSTQLFSIALLLSFFCFNLVLSTIANVPVEVLYRHSFIRLFAPTTLTLFCFYCLYASFLCVQFQPLFGGVFSSENSATFTRWLDKTLDPRCYYCYCYHSTTYLLFNSSFATNNASYTRN